MGDSAIYRIVSPPLFFCFYCSDAVGRKSGVVRMRARRPPRPPPVPGIHLQLPSQNTVQEVPVRQKKDTDVDSFFINADETMESPMISTSATFVNPQKGTGNNTELENCTTDSNTVKFFHVNDTNLFILVDGISMFVEGQSTFRGPKDELFLEQLRRRKREKTDLLGSSTKRLNGLLDKAAALESDSVGDAIRRVENVPSSFASPLMHSRTFSTDLPATGPNPNSRSQRMSPPVGSSTSISDSASVAGPAGSLTPYDSLFVSARKPPQFKPLFRHGYAKRVSILRGGGGGKTTSNPASSPTRSTNDVIGSTLVSSTEAATRHAHRAKHKPRLFSPQDVGHTNTSLELEKLDVIRFIDRGTQGSVYMVEEDGKLYALKIVDVPAATEASNDSERHGRKKGLIQELKMIEKQREREPPKYIILMFNAVASVTDEKKISILLELMSFGVDKIAAMLPRLPQDHLDKLKDKVFRKHLAKGEYGQKAVTLQKAYADDPSTCRRVMGRKRVRTPEDFEWKVERQNAFPEIVLSFLAYDVLHGLQELHRNYRIVHCDLKPANVLLTFDKKTFKIADFGCGCALDNNDCVLATTGTEQGTKLYKAPERLATGNQTETVDRGDDLPSPKFGSKADVWSLGIMILELANGVHPCERFKSKFWTFQSELHLSKMIKPLSWTPALSDFIVRTVCVKVEDRWSVEQLLHHPFVLMYENVPRLKLASYVEHLTKDSASYQRNYQREQLRKQIAASMNERRGGNLRAHSAAVWRSFTGNLSSPQQRKNPNFFPQLK